MKQLQVVAIKKLQEDVKRKSGVKIERTQPFQSTDHLSIELANLDKSQLSRGMDASTGLNTVKVASNNTIKINKKNSNAINVRNSNSVLDQR